MDNLNLPSLREKSLLLPHEPGVYIMRNQKGEIIYIGKAKNLRNRVSSYFRSVDKHTPKVYRMVENVVVFDYIVTGSEFEALVLECSMIKLNKPKYNILLKDDKGYNYIRISNEPYPRITAEKQLTAGDGAKILGPFMSSLVATQTVEETNRIFMLPTCRRKFPEDFRKERPCLNYHIKRCMGVCTGKITQSQYRDIIEQCEAFISTGGHHTVKRLEQEMQKAAEQMNFERAAQLRDRIRAIQRITEHQNVVFVKAGNQDVVALVQSGGNCIASILKIRERRLVDKLDFELGEVDELEETRQEFLISYYSTQEEIPKDISIDGGCADQELVEKFLSEKAGRQVQIRLPERGERASLVEMARKNAAETLSRKMERTGKEVVALDELARLLSLPTPPVYIESYDISNMGSDTVVAGMVVFENGRPLKSAYRKFNIKTIEGTDDYGSMREIISRRFARWEEEKESNEGFGRLPDLILLDGGKGHVNAVAPVLEDFGLDIPLFGMVKDKKHRTRAIATNGGEIAIQSSRSAFTLLSQIQDEVHRFSITHMKKRHSKTTFHSYLTQVPEIGPARAKGLLRHFKTQKALSEASVEQFLEVKGMSKSAATNLYEALHNAEKSTPPLESLSESE